MPSLAIVLAGLTALLQTSIALPAPAADPPRGGAYSGTCSNFTLDFEDLPNSAGHSRYLNNSGFNYHHLTFRNDQYDWVSRGVQETYSTDSRSKWMSVDVTTHSGDNALITEDIANGEKESKFRWRRRLTAAFYSFESGDNPKVCHGWHFDLKSLWVRGSVSSAFQYRLRCKDIFGKAINQTFNVPALAGGQYYQIKPDATKFKKLYICDSGALDVRMTLIDDMSLQLCDLNTCG